jgi:predicted site-specific integrase-resolvase
MDWLSKRQMYELHHVPIKALERWAKQGLIRKSKFSATKQSRAMYSVGDVQRVMNNLATGRVPRKDGAL